MTPILLCKYCLTTPVPLYGGVCEKCTKIAYLVREEVKRELLNEVEQRMKMIIRELR